MTDTAAKPDSKAPPVAPAAPVVEAKPVAKAAAPAAPASKPPVAVKAPAPAPMAKAMPVPAPAPKTIPAAVSAKPAVKETKMNDTIKTITDKTQAMFSGGNDRAKEAMEKSGKMFEEMNAFGKGNIEAMVESSKIAAKGAEDIAKYSAEYARTAVEKAKANAQHFASVKSPTELFKLQGDLAKEAMEAMMTEGAKFTENYLKLLGQIAQPISNRFAVAAEKVKIAA